MRAALLLLLALAACDEGLARWDLAHTRVLAVRASPPGLAPGETATLDALVSDDVGTPTERAPTRAYAAPGTPPMLLDAVRADGTVVAPDAGVLADVRASLGLPADADVPLTVRVELDVDGQVLLADKQVWLGRGRAPRTLGAIRVDGVAATAPLVVRAGAYAVEIDAEAPRDAAAWATSRGELDDADDARATWTVTAEDLGAGHLVVVVRDDDGAAAWQVLPVRVDG